jgi:Fe-S-cluster-containing dehydrogenase component/DMSO reductase anchor subunit
MVAPRKNPTLALIDELLAEQGQLQTPAARFATAHESASTSHLSTLNSQLSRQLIPLTAPGPGEHYAFEVELDACTGCKACVSACHSLNGLDDEETWRDVGLLVSPDPSYPFSQTVTTACHHCADPACLNGCPVLAYEKNPVTGVVVHLDDQCIGCSYCVLKCPYDVPKYNATRGVVRKCDLCHGRLAAGEAPACAQACPTSAIRIITIPAPNSDLRTPISGSQLSTLSSQLPPHPAYTQPTTRYVSKKPLPQNLVAADAVTLKPQPTHWPLALMLTLLPLAVGCNVLAALPHPETSSLRPQLLLVAVITGAFGLFASVFHLGKPLRAWRIFLGLCRSWLSREAVLFGRWFPVAVLAALAPRIPRLAPLNLQLLPAVSASIGILALFCSVMIYVDTHRHFWRFAQTAPRFFGTALILAFAATLALAPISKPLVVALIAVTLCKLSVEARVFRPLDFAESDTPMTPGLKTARLLSGPLRALFGWRVIAGLFGGVFIPFALAARAVPPTTVWLILALLLAGELTERVLFFRAVDAPKMPGLPA